MSRNCYVESGIQFLSRVSNRAFDLRCVDTYLFDEGVKANDLVELSAESVFLKNALLAHLIRKIVLVPSFKGVLTNGLNSRVLYIDLSCQFDVNEFVSSLRQHLVLVDSVRTLNVNDTAELIGNTLRNLVVVRCYSGHQLRSTLHSLRYITSSDRRIKLVVVDGFACHYWEEVASGQFQRLDANSKNVLTLFHDCLKSVNLVGLYVKPQFCSFTSLRDRDKVSYELHVHRKDDRVEVLVSTKLRSYSRFFIFGESLVLVPI